MCVLCFATKFLAWDSVCVAGWWQIDKIESKIRERRALMLGNSKLPVRLAAERSETWTLETEAKKGNSMGEAAKKNQ